MARYSKKRREEARKLYLTGELTSVAEIARRLKIKPHTVGMWKAEEDWDTLRIRIEKRAAEQLVEKIATERVTLNTQHYKLWNGVVARMYAAVGKDRLASDDIRDLERVAAILEKAQKGQRLARGLSLDGQTEEQIRAEAAADSRTLVDRFIEVVKARVPDEEVRDQICQFLLELSPKPDDEAEA